jgi:hypothetical protein
LARDTASTALARQPRVPSLPHEILVELFHECPDLVRELLRRCRGIDLPGIAEARTADLTQIVPTEYRADGVIVFHEGDVATAAAVVEIQRNVDPDKRWTWPLYVAALGAKERCPVLLVVIATDDAVARWAQTPLESGHPGHVLAPIVIAFRDVPTIDDKATARQLPELVVLSALARRSTDIVDFLDEAINQLPQNRGSVYLDLLYNVVPGLREEMMKRLKYEFQTEFARQYYGDGLEDGRKLGREEAREEFREALIEAARVKITNLTSDEESAIRRLSVERAHSVMRALVTAGDSETARAALTEAIRSDQS